MKQTEFCRIVCVLHLLLAACLGDLYLLFNYCSVRLPKLCSAVLRSVESLDSVDGH